jgi:hypothetical protein
VCSHLGKMVLEGLRGHLGHSFFSSLRRRGKVQEGSGCQAGSGAESKGEVGQRLPHRAVVGTVAPLSPASPGPVQHLASAV